MDGTTTALGRFEGIGRDPTVRAQPIKVTGAFDELVGPARGWTYLFASSSNHIAARNLALRAQARSGDSAAAHVDRDLARVIPDVVTAYLKGDEIRVQAYADPDRLPGVRLAGTATQVGDTALVQSLVESSNGRSRRLVPTSQHTAEEEDATASGI